jgi:hypothetical protein
MKTSPLALLLLAALSFLARGQEATSLPPGFKVLNQNPGHWITITSLTVPTPPNSGITLPPPPPQGKLPPGGTTITEIIRSGQTAHIIATDFQGKSDRWCVGKVQFLLRDGWNIPVWINGPTGPHASVQYLSLNSSMFPELSWVSPSTLVGIQPVSGSKCFAFVSGLRTAYLDVGTLRPVMLVTPNATYVYKILPPPSGDLDLPPNLQSLEKSIIQQQAPHPYRPPQA